MPTRRFPLKPKSVTTPPVKYRWEPHREAEEVPHCISLAPICDDHLQVLLDFHTYRFQQAGADRVTVSHDAKNPGYYLFTVTYPERPAKKVPTRISRKKP